MAACQFESFRAARTEEGIGEMDAGARVEDDSTLMAYLGLGLTIPTRDRVIIW
jgi:hypothetical protein